jgi:HlyD family secretion protein
MKTYEERRPESQFMEEVSLSPTPEALKSPPDARREPGTSKRKKRRRKWIVLGALFVVIAAGGGTAYYYKTRTLPIEIQTESAQRRNLTEVVVANGKIQPVLQVKISPEVSGEIIELPVKEGQLVKKGDLLLRIKPDYYLAMRRSAEASYQSALASKNLAAANLKKAEIEFKRNEELFQDKLISESAYQEFKTGFEVAEASFQSSEHQVDVANAALSRASEELAKTTIYSPIAGTVSKLNSELGERVVGTAMMSGTEVMTIADLNQMEARVDIGEIDVVLIAVGQKARLEVDAFRDRKFNAIVTEIANSSKGNNPSSGGSSGGGGGGGGQQQEATRFEVRLRVQEKEPFRPGMSVTSEIETRYVTNVLTVPIQSVTTRLPKGQQTNAAPEKPEPQRAEKAKKDDDSHKPIEVVFMHEGDTVRMVPVKRGISDDNYTEITEGLSEGQTIVSGGYKAISRELEEGKKVKKGSGKPKDRPEKS